MSKNIRLRDLTGTAPKAIFLPTHTIKDLGKGYVYTVPEVAIQNVCFGTVCPPTFVTLACGLLDGFHVKRWRTHT